MDKIDKRLLDIIQDEFPLTSEPYREIASLLAHRQGCLCHSISAEEVILRLKRMKVEGIIRRIGAIFDSKKLGYCSTLCAMKVPGQRVGEVAQIVNEYPGVTHNYIRAVKASKSSKPFHNFNDFDDLNDWNMWFTITARSQSELDRVRAEIREKSGIHDLIDLPAVRMFKIRVRFPMLGMEGDTRHETRDMRLKTQESEVSSLKSQVSNLECEGIVKELQGDIALCHGPFRSIADRLGIEEEELLTKIRELKDSGVIRRFSAVLHHRNVGIRANAMGVWCVPEGKVEEVGAKMATFPQVSHCYQRVTQPGWRYNVFTMIHGKTVEDCQQVANLISKDTEVKDYRLLYSIRELKKVSMKYFV